MNIKQIESNEDYQSALKEIEKLMDATESDASKAEHLMALVREVEIYEKSKNLLGTDGS